MARSAPALPGLLHVVMFAASGCVMTIELVAGRLAAPFIGVSLYTWTGIIGAVLAGMGFGAMLGGVLADRFDPHRLLVGGLLLASLLAASIPLSTAALLSDIPRTWPPLVSIFTFSLALFGVPALVLGGISPVLYKLAVRDIKTVGSTVGRLSAAGIAGSLAGTYATGFYLIPTFGTRAIVLGVAALLLLLGVAHLSWTRLRAPAVAAIVLVCVAGSGALAGAGSGPSCDAESAYYCIRVSHESFEDDGERYVVKKLVLDRLVHSGVVLERPDELWYPYEQGMAWILNASGMERPRTLFIGGGAYILPAWVERHHPGATIDVVEIDPEVSRFALREFAPTATRLTTYNTDARIALARLPDSRTYDVVFGDAFNDVSVPYHLTTREFAQHVRDRLAPGGLYVMNVVDRPEGAFVAASYATLASVFDHVHLLPGDGASPSSSFDTYLLVASDARVPLAEWAARLPPPTGVVEIPAPANGIVLTDDHAPVDQLLLPVFRVRWSSS